MNEVTKIEGRAHAVRKAAQEHLSALRAERLARRQERGGVAQLEPTAAATEEPFIADAAMTEPVGMDSPTDSAGAGAIADLDDGSANPDGDSSADSEADAVSVEAMEEPAEPALDDDDVSIEVAEQDLVQDGDDPGPSATQADEDAPAHDISDEAAAPAEGQSADEGASEGFEDGAEAADVKPDAAESDLFSLPGAGPGLVWVFQQAGIASLADLAVAEPGPLAEKLGLVGELLDLDHWIGHAKGATEG